VSASAPSAGARAEGALPVADVVPRALRSVCECELCRAGETTALHSDASHDQRLVQDFIVGDASLRVVGGTTKCARTFLAYALAHPAEFVGRSVLELGAGAGLVSIGLAVGLGCAVDATDQEPVLELLQENIDRNVDPARHRVRALTFQWGESVDVWRGYDLIVGTDLNFARENMAPLLATLRGVAVSSVQVVLLASLRRAVWEDEFFRALALDFETDLVLEAGEVRVHRFVRRCVPADAPR